MESLPKALMTKKRRKANTAKGIMATRAEGLFSYFFCIRYQLKPKPKDKNSTFSHISPFLSSFFLKITQNFYPFQDFTLHFSQNTLIFTRKFENQHFIANFNKELPHIEFCTNRPFLQITTSKLQNRTSEENRSTTLNRC